MCSIAPASRRAWWRCRRRIGIRSWNGRVARSARRFILAEGVNFVAQPEAALAAVRTEAEKWPVPFALAALASLTSLAGSALIALALARGRLGAVDAWNAAHVDEDWNTRQWGEDADAMSRRAQRLAEFEAAAKMLALLDRP